MAEVREKLFSNFLSHVLVDELREEINKLHENEYLRMTDWQKLEEQVGITEYLELSEKIQKTVEVSADYARNTLYKQNQNFAPSPRGSQPE